MRKKVQIHMLPTDKNAAFFTNKKYPELFQIGDNTVDNPHWQGQHLYFTSDEKIEANNWCINRNGDTLYQIKEIIAGGIEVFWRKIVATTNPDLWSTPPEGEKYTFDEFPYVPKIGLDFVKRYVNKEGNVKEVELEYELINGRVGKGVPIREQDAIYELNLRSDGTVIIHDIKEKMYTREELKNKVWIAYTSGYTDGDSNPRILPYEGENFDKWFDENYPK